MSEGDDLGADETLPDAITDAPADAPLPVLAIPESLDADGQEIWRRIVPGLETAGRVKLTDLEAITRYCDMVAAYWKMRVKVTAEGSTMLVPTIAKDAAGVAGGMWRRHPLLSELRAMAKALEGIEDRFGMSPCARADLVNRQLGRGGGMLQPGLPLAGGMDRDRDATAANPSDFH